VRLKGRKIKPILVKSKAKKVRETQQTREVLQGQETPEQGVGQGIKADILQIGRTLIPGNLPKTQEEGRAQTVDEIQTHQQKADIDKPAQASERTMDQETGTMPGAEMGISAMKPLMDPAMERKTILKEMAAQVAILQVLKGIHLCAVGQRKAREKVAANPYLGRMD
jgi:hypothetical protein